MEYEKIYHYDVESFPTFACVTFLDEETDEVHQFSIGCGRNELGNLKKFINRNILLVSFNGISYDDAVLRYLTDAYYNKHLVGKIFQLSSKLVDDNYRRDKEILRLRYPYKDKFFEWHSLDLFKLHALDRKGISLKQIAIILGHEKIQDLPYPPNYPISTEEEVETVLKYNINDVLITKRLYHYSAEEIAIREEIGKSYGVDVMSASRSKMGNIILEKYYREEFGVDIRELRERRTKRTSVNLNDCIPESIQFSTEPLKKLRQEVENTTVYSYNKFKFSRKIRFHGTDYSIASGGIHSDEKPNKYYSTDDVKIISCDIGSMYPSCMLINEIYPKHLGKDFLKVLRKLTNERLASKKTNKAKADALKITINGIYGKLNSDTFWLEDAKAMLRVTISGQLYIMMLVEMLEEQGIHCFSANTDGIECKVPVELEETYYKVCFEWEKKTGFILEYVEYSKYIKRDVNAYVALGTKDSWLSHEWKTAKREFGKIKTKNIFVEEPSIMKAYMHPIIPKAVNKYFIGEIPVEKTILESNDILDFCMSQNVGNKFSMELVTIDGIQKLQKKNRFYISNTKGGRLQKRSPNGKTTGLAVGQNVSILNDYDPQTPMKEYDLNRMWYIIKARKLIEDIEVTPMDMFANVDDFGKKTLLVEPPEKKPTIKPVKENEIKDAYRTKDVFAVDPHYLLVTDTDLTYSPKLKFYNLKKGTSRTLKIDKTLFRDMVLRVGDVVLAQSFEKKPRFIKEGRKFVETEGEDWWLTSYSIVDDFSNFKRKVYE